jgi:hypothetical protein
LWFNVFIWSTILYTVRINISNWVMRRKRHGFLFFIVVFHFLWITMEASPLPCLW